MVVLDTNVVIDHLRQTAGKSYLTILVKELPKEELAISVMTVQELYEGKSTRDEQKERAMLGTISPLKILPYTYETAQLAGEIARDLSHSIEFADAAIAATTVINGAQLATLDKKDFSGIKDLALF